jgi:hypothetical protein
MAVGVVVLEDHLLEDLVLVIGSFATNSVVRGGSGSNGFDDRNRDGGRRGGGGFKTPEFRERLAGMVPPDVLLVQRRDVADRVVD